MQTGKKLRGFLNLHFALALVLGLASHSSTAIAQSASTFTPAADMTTARAGHTATLFPNGKVLIAGGAGSSAELYDRDTEKRPQDQWG